MDYFLRTRFMVLYGLTQSVLIQALPYVGYPAIATVLAAAAEVIKEHGLNSDQNYTGHRGLL